MNQALKNKVPGNSKPMTLTTTNNSSTTKLWSVADLSRNPFILWLLKSLFSFDPKFCYNQSVLGQVACVKTNGTVSSLHLSYGIEINWMYWIERKPHMNLVKAIHGTHIHVMLINWPFTVKLEMAEYFKYIITLFTKKDINIRWNCKFSSSNMS